MKPVPPAQAYSRARRVRHAFWFIREMFRLGPDKFEATKSKLVGKTYGLDEALVKKIKKRFRNELSFSGEGK